MSINFQFVFAQKISPSFVPAFWQVFYYQFLRADSPDFQYLFYILSSAQKGKVIQKDSKILYQFIENNRQKSLFLEYFVIEEESATRYLFQFECIACQKPFFYQIETKQKDEKLIWKFQNSKIVFLKKNSKRNCLFL